MVWGSTDKKENWPIAGKKKKKMPLFLQLDAAQPYHHAHPESWMEFVVTN